MQKIIFLRTSSALNEPRVVKEAQSLASAGYNVLILAWDREKVIKRDTSNGNITFKQLRFKAPFASSALIFFFPIYWVWATLQTLINKPTVIHACDFDTLFVGVLVRMFRQKVSIVYDCFEYYPGMINSFLNSQSRGLISFIDKIFTSIADCVIIPSEERKKFYKTARNILIVPNTPKTVIITTEHMKQKQFTVFYGGGLETDRGIVTILKAAASLTDVTFVLVGDGTLKSTVKKASECFHNIKYIGFIPHDKLLERMAIADVSVAFYEASNKNNVFAASSKVYDSMMLGIPLITNNECASSKTVSKHNCGLSIPYGDVSSLIIAILNLKNNPKLRTNLGASGQIAFRRLYAWETVEPQLIKKYNILTKSKTR